MTWRSFGAVLVLVSLLTTRWLGDSVWADRIRWAVGIYVIGGNVMGFVTGYRRRRSYWTGESWRRYALACSMPLVALVTAFGIMYAIEAKLPIMGASRSSLRMVWAMTTLGFLVVGAIGLSIVKGWLHRGEPEQPFTLPRWLTFK